MNSRNPAALGTAALLLAVAACGSGGNSGNGSMTVHLVDAPSDYKAITLNVKSVEIWSQGTGWLTLATPNRSVDLLKLHDGVEEVLAQGASLPAGTYGQMRLVLNAGNTVTLADESEQPLKVPSGMQSGVKLPVHFEVEPGTTKDVFIDFDAHRSIFLHQAGRSGQYILRPVVRALDRVVTGSVSGKISGADGVTGLDGVPVMAEVVDASGHVTVVNSAVTHDGGLYSIGLLPVGASYYIVAQPVVGETVYAPRSSGAIALSATSPLATYNGAFSPVSAAGSLSVAITPVGDADDMVSAMQPLEVGEPLPRLLAVRTVNAMVVDDTETATFDNLPLGAYTLSATRSTSDAEGNVTTATSSSVSTTVPQLSTPTLQFQ